jgi:hypothetical protein
MHTAAIPDTTAASHRHGFCESETEHDHRRCRAIYRLSAHPSSLISLTTYIVVLINYPLTTR